MKTIIDPSLASNRGKKGFSLVEATIGLGTMSTVILALYSAIISAFGGIQFARENLRASQILVEKMDAIRLLSWDQINTPGFVPAKFSIPFDPAGVTNGPGGGFNYTGTVTFENGPTDVTYGSDLKYVTVKLIWNSHNHGMSREREFKTLVTRNGLQSYIY